MGGAVRHSARRFRRFAYRFDDLVSYRGTLLQVVAMSHKQKVVLRTPGKKKGGFWVAACNCTLVKRHARKEN